jgi:carboxypeptidase C (cathepsin A)
MVTLRPSRTLTLGTTRRTCSSLTSRSEVRLPSFSSRSFPSSHLVQKTHLVFLISCAVGFSYSEHGARVSTTEQADIQAFIAIFFATFKEFKGRPLHLSGESYGGRYLPVFAGAIHDGNKALVKAGGDAINLKSVLIGNGITDSYSMFVSSLLVIFLTPASGIG